MSKGVAGMMEMEYHSFICLFSPIQIDSSPKRLRTVPQFALCPLFSSRLSFAESPPPFSCFEARSNGGATLVCLLKQSKRAKIRGHCYCFVVNLWRSFYQFNWNRACWPSLCSFLCWSFGRCWKWRDWRTMNPAQSRALPFMNDQNSA